MDSDSTHEKTKAEPVATANARQRSVLVFKSRPRALLSSNVNRVLACPVNESQAKPTKKRLLLVLGSILLLAGGSFAAFIYFSPRSKTEGFGMQIRGKTPFCGECLM